MYCTKTCKGRVVYNRKKHEFKIRDLARISSKMPGNQVVNIMVYEWDWRLFTNELIKIAKENPEFNFGGGSFGGGGATRDFNYFGYSDLGGVLDEIEVLLIWKES